MASGRAADCPAPQAVIFFAQGVRPLQMCDPPFGGSLPIADRRIAPPAIRPFQSRTGADRQSARGADMLTRRHRQTTIRPFIASGPRMMATARGALGDGGEQRDRDGSCGCCGHRCRERRTGPCPSCLSAFLTACRLFGIARQSQQPPRHAAFLPRPPRFPARRVWRRSPLPPDLDGASTDLQRGPTKM